jgi:type II secretory pathway component PulM
MNLRATVRGWGQRPAAYLSSEWNRMAPRERRLVAGLISAVVAFAVLVTGFLFFESLRDLSDQNEDARTALADIAKHRDEYLEAKERMVQQEVRIGSEPPQLPADLEAASHEVNIAIPESIEEPAVDVGKHYREHKVDLKLRQVELQPLSKFLNKIETGRRLIIISRLDIRRRFSEGQTLDVELTATAYERLKDNARRKPAAGGTGKGASQ